ncbi:hypothetical protein KK141_11295 [Dyella sp. LX-66]|uniref:hypothetical protein n=1 Tax=unclassified Dyella TaxID=2634549 RepID=UPI001BE08428|nr:MULTISPECIES: hypothetical protein [unclassified Dyella]MBT2118892.1 hypothetical protein [Dyella sp. LX-1]MBT2140115.1 hypothetical protein [Dyella sp. LX-66]
MKMALQCVRCETVLTDALTIVSEKTPGVVQPQHKEGESFIPRGVAFESWEPIERACGDAPSSLEFVPQCWLNPDDLNESVHDTYDARRLNGCCGLDGCDGPNQVCRCGADVGTLRTDCWTPRVFIPDPKGTKWIMA